ncbi:MAG: polysaccharide biosynthesis/export family protein [Terriglobales bacterium]
MAKRHFGMMGMLGGRSLLGLALLALVMGAPCAAQGGPAETSANNSDAANDKGQAPSAAAAGFQERNPRYRLLKGDSFDVDFAFSPEFNQTVVVQPDGYITLRGAGSMRVEGQTVPELTETIKKAYASILHNPVVTVALKDFEKPYFVAAGQVAKPGKYDLRSDLTLVEAVAIAGGFTANSKHSQVVLFRRVSDQLVEARLFNVKQMLQSRDLSEDAHLRPGDMIYVPQNMISKIQRFITMPSTGMYFDPTKY